MLKAFKIYRVAFWRETPHFNNETRKMEQRWELWIHSRRFFTYKRAQRWALAIQAYDGLTRAKPGRQHVVLSDSDVHSFGLRIPMTFLGQKGEGRA